MNLTTIPPGIPFLDTLAEWWLDRAGPDPLAAADGLILLPTRRAARSLTEAFLRVAKGRPLLLPRIAAIGALDEAPLALAGALDLPPAVDRLERLAQLTRLVMALDDRFGAPGTADGAWRLARELTDLLDEAHRAEIDLHETLPKVADAAFAEHWGRTVEFLQIVTAAWPAWLRDNGRVDPAARASKLLETQATAWSAAPPAYPVVIAGTTGGVPAVGELMRTVARLPNGTVILPGLDLEMADEVWQELGPGHPQAGMRDLLARIGATRGDVDLLSRPGFTPTPSRKRARAATSGNQLELAFAPPAFSAALSEQSARAATIWRALLPAKALASWRDRFTPHTEGLLRLDPADQQEEAVAIALALRDALEQPNARAALVTPDRGLALRVAAELARYGVVVDNSAGEKLADTPPAAFLRLIARTVADDLAPITLLSVLKHPLAAFGLSPGDCRRAARDLERARLRGPAPPPGIAGLRALAPARMLAFVDRLEATFAPLLGLGPEATPAAALRALLETAEAAAATHAEPGAIRLWAHEEGEALATHLTSLAAALPVLPAQKVGILPGLLEATMEGEVVRSRRALRGRYGAEHPRVAILGLLEARLQSFDRVVLGGLVEGVWPPATDPGPWMGRAMRTAAGLTSPEERVGQMAHDFAMLACAAPIAILSCPRRRDGAPAVPARWLVRLHAFLDGNQAALTAHPAAEWARLLDQPAGSPDTVKPPAPRPPVDVRPRKLGVTEVAKWLRDPYAIYARHILRLRVLDPIEQSADASDYGEIVHNAIAAWVTALPADYPADAATRLRREMEHALELACIRPALAAWWRPRLGRIAHWLAAMEAERRANGAIESVAVELEAEWEVPDANFRLKGRADRIERRRDGSLALIDYKTGSVPKKIEIDQGYASQLLLEAAMAAGGAFPGFADEAAELAYWRLTGGRVAGEIWEPYRKEPGSIPGKADATVQALAALIAKFDDPATPYLAQPHPDAAPRFDDYGHLARVAEWSAADDDA